MNQHKSDQPPLYLRIGCGAVLCLVVLAIYPVSRAVINQNRRHAEANAEERIREKIADVKSGKATRISLDNDTSWGELDNAAFVKAKGELGEANPYELDVMYSHNVDDFLKQIAGARGLRSLLLYHTDVSDAGLDAIATLPDLKELSIDGGKATAAALDALRTRLPDCTISVERGD